MTVTAAPADLVYAFLDLPTAALATPLGPLFVRPTGAVFDAYAIPASGSTTRSDPVPPLPTGLHVVLQPIRLGTDGGVELGPAAPLLIE
ncbi:MAG: hypothetical protein IPM29_20020 [Planctomycetes bacterium]|nr:hypothetical protein [Planctomycetota bacterium]